MVNNKKQIHKEARKLNTKRNEITETDQMELETNFNKPLITASSGNKRQDWEF